MLIATVIVAVGLLAGIAAAQLRGLRLGGVIVVPLTAVYLLRDFTTFPVFVVSVVAAYVSLWIVKNRLLLFGRRLFVVSVLVGAVVPVTVFQLATVGFEPSGNVAGVDFVVTILPGIAAYNFHRLSLEDRILDAVWSLATLLFLVVLGIGLVIAVGLSPLSTRMPPVLLSAESDIAIAFGLEVQRELLPMVASRWELVALLGGGLLLSEGVRWRYGLRIAGVVVLPLLVLIAFRNAWMLPLWAVTAALSFAGVVLLHRWSLVYGRVLLSMSVVFGLLAAVALTPLVPVRHGLLPFFVGLLGSVTAYNVHAIPPAERPTNALVSLSSLVALFAFARALVVPAPAGLLTSVTELSVLVGLCLFVPGVFALYRLERTFPAGYTVLPVSRPARPEVDDGSGG